VRVLNFWQLSVTLSSERFSLEAFAKVLVWYSRRLCELASHALCCFEVFEAFCEDRTAIRLTKVSVFPLSGVTLPSPLIRDAAFGYRIEFLNDDDQII